MNNSRGVYAGTAALALSAGLLFTASPAQAGSVIDETDAAGNTVQVTHTDDVFQPQFSLWPLGPNVATIETHGNVANDGGNNTTGIPWLLGHGAGNVVQVGSGGNVVAPQTAIGTDNYTTITTWGNEAINNGNGSNSASGGQTVGHVMDGNGNVFQLVFFQGNVIAPQFAVNGDNHAVINSYGNYAQSNGNGSSSEGNGGALALVNGNGNIVQIMFLSNNVIAPQVAINGSNDTVIHTDGNLAYDNGNGSVAVSHAQAPLSLFGIPGLFTITTVANGNGNITQIAILSNNVWAPQVAIPGPRPGSGTNTSAIDTLTNDAQTNGNESETDTDNAQGQHQVGNGNTDQTAHDSGAIDNPQIGGKTNVAVNNPVNTSPPPVVNTTSVKTNDSPPPVVADEPKVEPKVVVQDEPKVEPKVETVKADAPDMTTGNKVEPPKTTTSSDDKKSDGPNVTTGNKVEPTVKAGDDSASKKDNDPSPAAAAKDDGKSGGTT